MASQLVSDVPHKQVQMIEKAWADPSVKQEMLNSIKPAVSRDMGENIPDFIDIKLLEETPHRMWLIVPPHPSTLPEPEPDHSNPGNLKPNELQSKQARAEAVKAAFENGELDAAQMVRAVFEQSLVVRAWAKDGFMQELLVNARALVEQTIAELGLPVGPLPASLEIRALEETATRRYMLLPNNPGDAAMTDLEQAVAAGLGQSLLTRGTSSKWRSANVNAWGYSLDMHGITLPYCGAFAQVSAVKDATDNTDSLTVCTLASSDGKRSLQVKMPL
jgi:hypothetical protein